MDRMRVSVLLTVSVCIYVSKATSAHTSEIVHDKASYTDHVFESTL